MDNDPRKKTVSVYRISVKGIDHLEDHGVLGW